MATMQVTTESCTCPKCDGKGKLRAFSHIANGDCFLCGGSGTVSFKSFVGPNQETRFSVFRRDGQFYYAELRCLTWKPTTFTHNGETKQGREWGRDLFYKSIDDVQVARELWKSAGAVNQVWDVEDF